MQYVIRFPDGMFNSGYGFDVPLRDADRYATREEAEKVLRGDGADGSGGLVDGEVIEAPIPLQGDDAVSLLRYERDLLLEELRAVADHHPDCLAALERVRKAVCQFETEMRCERDEA